MSTSASALSAAQSEVSRIVAAIVSERDALARDMDRIGRQNDEMCDTIHDLREQLEAAKLETIEALAKTRPEVRLLVSIGHAGWTVAVYEPSGAKVDITPSLASRDQAYSCAKSLIDGLASSGVRATVAVADG